MNNDPSFKDPFLPLVLLAVSFIVFLAWQTSNVISQRESMQALSARGDQMSTQSHQAQAALQKLASDIIDAAKTDDIAKAIVTKYGMQKNTPIAPAP